MNYEVGYVYKLICKNTGKVYYGSTNNINRRTAQHKCALRMRELGHSYSSSIEIIEQNNYEFLVIETWFNISKYDLKREEAKYITQEECINKRIPNRTRKDAKNEPCKCNCGCIVLRKHLYRHKKTKKHIKKIEEKSQE